MPSLVMECGFIRCLAGTENMTERVATLYPYSVIFPCPCDGKGPDSYVTARCAAWVRQCGITQCTCMPDQESALGTMVAATVEQLMITAERVGANPEHGAIGESQRNGKAKRAVKEVEGMVSCFIADCAHMLNIRCPVRYIIMQWLVDYMGRLTFKHATSSMTTRLRMKKCTVNEHKKTGLRSLDMCLRLCPNVSAQH